MENCNLAGDRVWNTLIQRHLSGGAARHGPHPRYAPIHTPTIASLTSCQLSFHPMNKFLRIGANKNRHTFFEHGVRNFPTSTREFLRIEAFSSKHINLASPDSRHETASEWLPLKNAAWRITLRREPRSTTNLTTLRHHPYYLQHVEYNPFHALSGCSFLFLSSSSLFPPSSTYLTTTGIRYACSHASLCSALDTSTIQQSRCACVRIQHRDTRKKRGAGKFIRMGR